MIFFFFFFNDTATTEIYTLSLHDALPITDVGRPIGKATQAGALRAAARADADVVGRTSLPLARLALCPRPRRQAGGAVLLDLTGTRRVAHEREAGLPRRAARRTGHRIALVGNGGRRHRRATRILEGRRFVG